MRTNFIVIFFILNLLTACFSQKTEQKKIKYTIENAESIIPISISLVNDFSSVFTMDEKKELENLLKEFYDKTTNQIAIVTVDYILPYNNIQDYTTDLGNFWGIGKKGKDNGLVIVLNMQNREVRIGTGFGTEKILSEAFLKTVIDDKMIPYFKENQFYKGMHLGIDEIIKNWK